MKKKQILLTVLTMLTASLAFAAGDTSPQTYEVLNNSAGLIALAASIGMGLAVLGGAWGQSRAAAAAFDGIARNPSAQGKLFIPFILGLAFIESLVILAFIVNNGLGSLISGL